MSEMASPDPRPSGNGRSRAPADPLAASPRGGAASARELAAIAALTVLALAVRLYRLGDLPPGLHIDEAFNILDARAVIAGWRPVFLPANAGRDVLYTYMQAPLLAAFGESAAAARLASALIGAFTVPVAWGLVRALPFRRSSQVALLTAAFTTLSYWHLHFSRFGIRAVLFPLVTTLAMWAWWVVVRAADPPADVDRAGPGDGAVAARAVHGETGIAPEGAAAMGNRRAPVLAVVAAGVSLGLAAYAHPAGRFLFVVPVLHAGYVALRWRTTRPLRDLAAALAVAALVALPLVGYWAQHPGAFTGHAMEVSVVGGGPTPLAANAMKVAGMFNVAGDPAGWRNLTSGQVLARAAERLGARPETVTLLRGRPVFDVVTGLLFLLGLAWLAVRLRPGTDRACGDSAALILIWISVLLMPTIGTDAAPNFSRAIGVIPAVFVPPAVALSLLAARAAARWGRAAGTALIASALLWSGVLTVRDYFVVWANDDDTPIAFDADKVALAVYMDEAHADGRTVFLSPQLADHPTVRVLSDEPPRGFDPAHGLVIGSGGTASTEYVFPPDDPAWAALRSQLGHALLVGPIGARIDFRHAAEATAGIAAVEELGKRFVVGSIVFGDGLPTEPTALRLRLVEPMVASGGAFGIGGSARLLTAFTDPLVFVDVHALESGTEPLTTTVTLVWHVVAPIADDLSAMVHLTTPDGRGWGVGDGAPVGGTYPTSWWQPGELVFDTHVVVADPAPPDGEAEFRVGLYDWRSGTRLPARGPAAALREDGTAAVAATTTVVHGD